LLVVCELPSAWTVTVSRTPATPPTRTICSPPDPTAAEVLGALLILLGPSRLVTPDEPPQPDTTATAPAASSAAATARITSMAQTPLSAAGSAASNSMT
jgi:hypothetical protein